MEEIIQNDDILAIDLLYFSACKLSSAARKTIRTNRNIYIKNEALIPLYSFLTYGGISIRERNHGCGVFTE